MAIQGILEGFANPEQREQHVLLVGRGDVYVLLVNGKPEEPTYVELDEALRAFRQKAAAVCIAHWRGVSEVRTTCTAGVSVTDVTALSAKRFDNSGTSPSEKAFNARQQMLYWLNVEIPAFLNKFEDFDAFDSAMPSAAASIHWKEFAYAMAKERWNIPKVFFIPS